MPRLCACGCGDYTSGHAVKYLEGHKLNPVPRKRKRIYTIDGVKYTPPEGWIPIGTWTPEKSVKLCAFCRQPVWRNAGVSEESWANQLTHGGKCKGEQRKATTQAKRWQGGSKLTERQRQAMDAEQIKIDSAVAIRQRDRPFNKEYASKFYPQIAWLF